MGHFIGFANQYPIGAFMEKGLQAGAGGALVLSANVADRDEVDGAWETFVEALRRR